MNAQQFVELTRDVIAWNAVARDTVHNFSEASINKQNDYIHEEIKETIKALIEDNSVEVLDGFADIFVTLIYKYFLLIKGEDELADALYGINEELILVSKVGRESTYDLLNSCSLVGFYGVCENEIRDCAIAVEMLFVAIQSVEKLYDVDMYEVTKDVMQSNWSKYPAFWPEENYDLECQRIQEVRGMKNVSYKTVTVGTKTFVVFRDDFGNGKIMKPLSYTAANPAKFLNN